MREREAGEITPVSAEQSATRNNNEANNGAGLAIDLDVHTKTDTVAGADGTIWLKITLDKVYCVEQVKRYNRTGKARITWTCTEDDCHDCEGGFCDVLALTVSTERAVSDLSPVSDCKYGDTVKLEKTPGDSGDTLTVREIAIIGKSGKLNYLGPDT